MAPSRKRRTYHAIFRVIRHEETVVAVASAKFNNCDIYGAFEDMNLWVKSLRPEKTARAGESRKTARTGMGRKASRGPGARRAT